MDFQVGRTKWDILAHSARRIKSALLILLVLGVIVFGSQYTDTETVEAFVAGILLGWIIASFLLQPVGRFVLVVPKDLIKIRLIWIPEESFGQYNQPQAPACCTSFMGYPVYIANGFDDKDKKISYGWLTEYSPLRVAADRATYLEWYEAAEAAMIDNVRLKNYPLIYGSIVAREPMKELSDWLAQTLGMVSDHVNKAFVSDVLNDDPRTAKPVNFAEEEVSDDKG
ncbi:MAG: hypothetical protein LBJ20_00875 [Candidatus Methanoplasma sp.]|jgi:hypothetical protein|nr:hypothetical protein [Candidatus Methanoplasma sp.]